ncbi:carbohydrate ABC transporter permease [Microbacterium sp. 2P01SA-2]|jgi:raffinose/stachyose/melibiose transport system permease protein|uniref:Raffinose/stachyose/melibiose transport system permease protein n=3 Tax=Microbacterium TaxID=33882 RepID=A0ABU1I2U0_9MICO|nr:MULTISPECIES: carbohydrate ABC transporter permease [Microbacterium]MDF2579451.1 sugar transporter permease [Microbacterium sp.]APF34425.1 sugar ABC transporter permease [Microbacterium paludicola]MDQ1217516.1 raffinose/stachyose/melibiose transport system permease protein [Microbacterium arborescens]MDR6168201.1 raffinose/stachyose/melibiose transport system permease protein [Microbacterium paludicola]OAZ44895.1 sugar ABC transporter permease [Microbacterium arborescens]
MRTSAVEAWTGRIVLIVVMAFTIIPFITLFVTALHEPGTYPKGLSWPETPHWDNFALAFQSADMLKMLGSSALIELGVVPISLVIATLAGFALGHLRVPFARAIFVLFVLGLTLPFEGIIVPIYYQMKGYGLLNTQLAIVLPLIGLFMPFAVMWMRAHFVNMPHELTEAARIDGATTWQLFWRIHVPLSGPAISSLAILLFLWTWNQFLLAIVLVDDPTKRTMAGALGAFQGQWGTDIPLLCAGSILILLPTLLVFLIFQRQFVAALLQGAVKG